MCHGIICFDPDGQRTSSHCAAIWDLWPGFSGDRLFPLEGGAVAYYRDDQTTDQRLEMSDESYMWDRVNSPYAEQRWQLLEWLIDNVEKF